MAREWKPIKGYEDLYIISNFGDVVRLAGYDSRGHLRRAKVRRATKNSDGYMCIGLSQNGIETKFLVHRLVAEAFIDNPSNFSEINHKDEDRTNNCVENLEWCNRTYNLNYGNYKKNLSEAQKRRRARERKERIGIAQ